MGVAGRSEAGALLVLELFLSGWAEIRWGIDPLSSKPLPECSFNSPISLTIWSVLLEKVFLPPPIGLKIWMAGAVGLPPPGLPWLPTGLPRQPVGVTHRHLVPASSKASAGLKRHRQRKSGPWQDLASTSRLFVNLPTDLYQPAVTNGEVGWTWGMTFGVIGAWHRSETSHLLWAAHRT